ncbi:hypothetical protein FOMPIDRAFT_111991 [Fomitopsis schrenkii]|uniref:PPPDE domain-containing protein n=1 Tax=Fomitopsis schrenkii TaxID=2126942 RepID=S8DM32_FOMSC|nr:hypothetical protein FOMPIDRAFT_111991 [Fomitopsis schrenkii]
MRNYRVYLAQYSGNVHRPNDPNRHMEIVVITRLEGKTEIGIAFHITGDTTSWRFTVTEDLHWINSAYCGRIPLGTIPATPTALQALENLLRTNHIYHNDAMFNCQRWAWTAGLLMIEHKYPVIEFPHDFRAFLEAMEASYGNWNNGNDSD